MFCLELVPDAVGDYLVSPEIDDRCADVHVEHKVLMAIRSAISH